MSTALQLAMRAPFVNQNKTFQLASRVESSLLPKSFVLFSALTINLMLCFIWFAISIVVVVAVGITVTITVAAPARSVESVEELQLVAVVVVVVVVVLSCGSTWMLILCRHLMRPNELLMKLTARQGVSAHRHAHMQGTHVRLPCHKLKCQNIYSLQRSCPQFALFALLLCLDWIGKQYFDAYRILYNQVCTFLECKLISCTFPELFSLLPQLHWWDLHVYILHISIYL